MLVEVRTTNPGAISLNCVSRTQRGEARLAAPARPVGKSCSKTMVEGSAGYVLKVVDMTLSEPGRGVASARVDPYLKRLICL